MNDATISLLIGKTLKAVSEIDNSIIFTLQDDTQYKLYHAQGCCESVVIEDIEGNLQDLVDTEIIQAEEISNEDFENQWEQSFSEEAEYGGKQTKDGENYPESHTWTFYKFATIKGYVTIRWFGSSNGYYGEGVDFEEVTEYN